MKKFLLLITNFCLCITFIITMTACGKSTQPSPLDKYFVFDNVTYNYIVFEEDNTVPEIDSVAMINGKCWKYIYYPETQNESIMWFDGSKYYSDGDELSWSVSRVNGTLDALIDAFTCFKLEINDDDMDGIWTSSKEITTKTQYSTITYSNIKVTIQNERLSSVTYTHTNEFLKYTETLLVSYEFYNWGTTVI